MLRGGAAECISLRPAPDAREPVSRRLEDLRDDSFDAPGLEAQRKVCQDMQLQCMLDVPSLPLGQFVQPTAYRINIAGVLNGFATFWNVCPSEPGIS